MLGKSFDDDLERTWRILPCRASEEAPVQGKDATTYIYIWYKWFLYLYVHVCISYSSSPPTLSWFRTMECTIRCTFWGSFGSYNKQLNIRETWHDVLIHSGLIVGMWWPHHAFFCILLILACCFQNSKENPSPFFTVIDRNILFLSLQHPLFSCKHSRDWVP